MTTEDRFLDLDALRAARVETQGQPPKVKLNGVLYELPVELPVDFSIWIDEISKGETTRLRDVCRVLFGVEADNVRGNLTNRDMTEIFSNLKKLYGTDVGESVPSAEG